MTAAGSGMRAPTVPLDLQAEPNGRRGRVGGLHPSAAIVLAAGIVLTVVLAYAARFAYDANEDRLLRQRTREAAAVLTAALPGIQTPLAAAAEVAEEDDGDLASFHRLMEPAVDGGQPYVSASLWRVDADVPAPAGIVGSEPKLASQSPAFIREVLDHSVATRGLTVIGLLDGAEPRLGYSFTSSNGPITFIAYAEAALPTNRTSVVPPDSAFAGLANAVYLGDTESDAALLTASTPELPLRGRTASETVAFGDNTLLLVMSPTTELSGGLLSALFWVVGVVGLVTTGASTALVERLLRSRDRADSLAVRNQQLYDNQLSIARTLQHSLLPIRLPEIPGLDAAARYIPGVAGLDIGGDWYDLIDVDEEAVLIVVGDVSGRGLRAGTTMASLRYAIRAFASRGDDPSGILTGLTRLLDVHVDQQFATVLCARLELATRTVTIANAGHPAPLLVGSASRSFLPTDVGPPIGVTRDATYPSVTHALPDHAALLFFTDGLFERRGETIDAGMERLRRSLPDAFDSVSDLLDAVVSSQLDDATHDDSAIIGVRWTDDPAR